MHISHVLVKNSAQVEFTDAAIKHIVFIQIKVMFLCDRSLSNLQFQFPQRLKLIFLPPADVTRKDAFIETAIARLSLILFNNLHFIPVNPADTESLLYGVRCTIRQNTKQISCFSLDLDDK